MLISKIMLQRIVITVFISVKPILLNGNKFYLIDSKTLTIYLSNKIYLKVCYEI